MKKQYMHPTCDVVIMGTKATLMKTSSFNVNGDGTVTGNQILSRKTYINDFDDEDDEDEDW